MPTAETEIETLANREYKWGFVTDIEADASPGSPNGMRQLQFGLRLTF